jgi:hypothetical protein
MPECVTALVGGHHSHNTPNHTQPHPVPPPAPLAGASNVSTISSTGCSPLASVTSQSPLDRCITMLMVARLLMVCGLASSTSVVSGSGIFHVSVAPVQTAYFSVLYHCLLQCSIPLLTSVFYTKVDSEAKTCTSIENVYGLEQCINGHYNWNTLP